MNTTNRVFIAIILTGGLGATHVAADDGPFKELLGQYNEVRDALVLDQLDGAVEHAREIEKLARMSLEGEATSGDDAPEWSGLVEEIATAAAELGSAQGIDPARDAFFALSKPLSHYRKLIGDDSTVVAYCPMAKKAWLQPDGEIQNPYQGQEMPTCGNKIPD